MIINNEGMIYYHPCLRVFVFQLFQECAERMGFIDQHTFNGGIPGRPGVYTLAG